jgi:hypothetical protein
MAIITQIVEKIVEIRSNHKVPTAIFMSYLDYCKLTSESPQFRLYLIEDQISESVVATIYGIPVKIGKPICHCGETYTEEHGKTCFVCMVKGIPENFIQIV